MPAGTLTPIAGDPLAVNESARALEAVAANVAATSSRLRVLVGPSWSGAASVRASTRTATLPPKLDKVAASYSSAGAALRRYSTALADAQSRSAAAIRAAASARADVEQLRAERAAASAETALRYDAAISEAEARLARAAASNETAHDDQHRAAGIAARRLHDASAQGIKNQPWWRHVVSSAARFGASAWTTSLRVVAHVATSISALAGLAALAMSIAGLVFPPLEGAAAVLETISLVSGVMATGADAALAASGKGSWKSAGVDALMLAPWAGSKLVSKTARLLRPRTVVYARSATREATKTAWYRKGRSAVGDSWADPTTLADHVDRHGADFGVTSETAYADTAVAFFRRAVKEQLPMKLDRADGTIRVYDPATNTFGAYRADGRTRTFFKPDPARHRREDNWAYWSEQPGDGVWDGAE